MHIIMRQSADQSKPECVETTMCGLAEEEERFSEARDGRGEVWCFLHVNTLHYCTNARGILYQQQADAIENNAPGRETVYGIICLNGEGTHMT